MALTITAPTFGPVVFAKNPVIFKFRSLGDLGEPYAAQGATSIMLPGFVAQFAAGETLSIEYEEPDGTTETVVFTASPTYTAEDEIPDDTFVGTTTAYWDAVRLKVATHHRIAPYFTVTRASTGIGPKITIKAKTSDSGWVLTVTNTAGISVTDFPAVAESTPINYSVLMEVYFERSYKGGDYALAAQLKNTPDADGYLTFDISSILEAECQASMQMPSVPEWNETDSKIADNLRRYYIRYTEEYGTPILAQDWQYDEVRVCMNGGLSQALYAQGDFLADLDVAASILTWMPDGRKIGVDQPEWLAWYNWDTVARDVFVQVQWYLVANNATGSPIGFPTALTVGPQEVALLPVNPTLLGVPDTAYKYRVRVVYDDSGLAEVSQWRTYYLDRDYYNSERYVQYLNGFGVPECWRCTGVWGKKLGVDRVVAERPLLPDYNEFSTDSFQFRALWDQELTYNTGYLRRGEGDVLQEMLIAGDVYDVGEDGYIPIRITTNSFQVTDTEEDLHAYKFTAAPRLSSRNYSKQKLTVPASGAWQEPGGDSWFDAALVPWELP